MKSGHLIAVLLIVAGWAFAQDPAQSRPAADVEQILANMPENSDRRCVGISLVAAALIEGEVIGRQECEVPQDLAKRIYEAAFAKGRVQYHSILCLDNRRVPITSREGLNALATAVANHYKQRHLELIETAAGKQKLWEAESHVLRQRRELDALLEADTDHIVPFLVTGVRRFPDGEIKDTNHAVLITKNAAGETFIYDPNDPGKPIPCTIQAKADDLLITWTCRYRDTGIITTQQYEIIELDRFFREALARE